MNHELLSALSLMVVIEGLFLFAAPRVWKIAVEQLRQLSDRGLRVVGGVFITLGLLALLLVRS